MRSRIARSELRGSQLVAAFVTLPAPAVVEHLGRMDFDLLCIDAEHSPLDVRDLDALVRAGDVVGKPVFIRICELGPDVARVLDLGAAGVVVPRVETREQAAEAVRRARYAPDGDRGAGPGRASGYGVNFPKYLRDANQYAVVLAQIETVRGVSALDEIVTVDGLDGIFVGPRDLSVSLGVERGSDEHGQAMRRILSVSHDSGLATAMVCGSAAELDVAAEQQVNIVFVGTEMGFIVTGAGKALADYRAAINAR